MSIWAERSGAIADQFHKRGFAVVEGLADPACLETLRPIYDGMIDGSIPCPTTNRKLGGLTRQIVMPHLHHPSLRSNAAIDGAREVARTVQGTDSPDLVFSMMIYKPGGHPHETPWHQDMSYAGMPTMHAGARIENSRVLTFWLALDDVEEDMGCMEFIPAAQSKPMSEHFVFSGEPTSDDRLLAIRDPASVLDLGAAVKCPLRAGSATIHGYLTPHFTAPNRAARGRRAFIFTFNHPDTVPDVIAALTKRDQHVAGALDD